MLVVVVVAVWCCYCWCWFCWWKGVGAAGARLEAGGARIIYIVPSSSPHSHLSLYVCFWAGMADMARTAIDGAGMGLFARKAIAAVLLRERAMLLLWGWGERGRRVL